MGAGIVAILQERDVWLRHKPGERITIYQKDKELLLEIGKQVTEKLIPSGRSVSVNKYMQKEILQELDKAGVHYQFANYGNQSLPAYAEEVGISSEFIVFKAGHEANGLSVLEQFKLHIEPEKYAQPHEANQASPADAEKRRG